MTAAGRRASGFGRGSRTMTAAVAALALCAACGGHRVLPSLGALAHGDSVESTLFLIGDAGAPAPATLSVLDALGAAARTSKGAVVVAFLGDNVYPDGLPDSLHSERRRAERRLGMAVDAVVRAGARGIFVPGNHDWGTRTDTAASALRRQAAFIARRSAGTASLIPEPGCPGPSVIDIGTKLRVVALDTEWWLQNATNDAPLDPECSAHEETEIAGALARAVDGARGRNVVVLGHHPLVSGAAHGGHFGWRQHVFPFRDMQAWMWVPLPLLGSTYPLARQRGAWLEDVSNSAYRRMRHVVDSVFAEHSPLVYAAGHDHNLQLLQSTSARYLIVSGAGSDGQLTPVYRLPSTRFARQVNGFMRLEVMTDGRVRLGVMAFARGSLEEVFATWLV